MGARNDPAGLSGPESGDEQKRRPAHPGSAARLMGGTTFSGASRGGGSKAPQEIGAARRIRGWGDTQGAWPQGRHGERPLIGVPILPEGSRWEKGRPGLGGWGDGDAGPAAKGIG